MLKPSNIQRKKSRGNRRVRIRSRVKGTVVCPRLSVFRSNKHIIVQLVDDAASKTIVAARDQELGKKIKAEEGQSAGVARAYALGELLAKKAVEAKINTAVFDRGGYLYHGVIKAVADGARAGGLKF